jgi:hypothetical protein
MSQPFVQVHDEFPGAIWCNMDCRWKSRCEFFEVSEVTDTAVVLHWLFVEEVQEETKMK